MTQLLLLNIQTQTEVLFHLHLQKWDCTRSIFLKSTLTTLIGQVKLLLKDMTVVYG